MMFNPVFETAFIIFMFRIILYFHISISDFEGKISMSILGNVPFKVYFDGFEWELLFRA